MSIAESVYKPSEHVVMTEFDGEGVLLHIAHGAYYGLDEVGTDVWRLLSEGKQVGEIMRALLERYDAEATRLCADVERLLADLQQADLIQAA